MYFFNDLIFEIKKDKHNELKQIETALEFPDIFIKAYTDIKDDYISKLSEEEKEAFVKYIYDKLDITNEKLFIDITTKFVKKYNSNITYYMMGVLSKIGYKIDEMKKWALEDLIETFLLENIGGNKLNEVSSVLSSYYSIETKKAFDKMFNIEDKNAQERINLASQLEKL